MLSVTNKTWQIVLNSHLAKLPIRCQMWNLAYNFVIDTSPNPANHLFYVSSYGPANYKALNCTPTIGHPYYAQFLRLQVTTFLLVTYSFQSIFQKKTIRRHHL